MSSASYCHCCDAQVLRKYTYIHTYVGNVTHGMFFASCTKVFNTATALSDLATKYVNFVLKSSSNKCFIRFLSCPVRPIIIHCICPLRRSYWLSQAYSKGPLAGLAWALSVFAWLSLIPPKEPSADMFLIPRCNLLITHRCYLLV